MRKEYGQRPGRLNSAGTPIYLDPGQTVKELAIQLTPTAIVSGRIFDKLGQPAIGAPDSWSRTSTDDTENHAGNTVFASAETDIFGRIMITKCSQNFENKGYNRTLSGTKCFETKGPAIIKLCS